MASAGDYPVQRGSSTPFDQQMMHRAIVLARRGEGRVEPNPLVGCVIVAEGRIIGEGYHRRFGGPHAEIEALRACQRTPRGATVYVSLEPCCHHGKTPPCTDALIEAGVRRVVCAVPDPNPNVTGGGAHVLRTAGVAVDFGILADDGSALLAPFSTLALLHRPYVIAKWAQSLDGKLATDRGHSQWISCPRSRRHAHRLRARVDAILVGSGTTLADDPMLTAREVPVRRVASRVVLDGRLRLKTKGRLATTTSEAPVLVLTARGNATSPKAQRLRGLGVEVIGCSARRGGLRPADCLDLLAGRHVTNLLIEGGPKVLTSFFQAGLVDEAYVFTAPTLIGGDGAAGAIVGKGASRVEDALAAHSVRTRRSGIDTLYHLRFTVPPATR